MCLRNNVDMERILASNVKDTSLNRKPFCYNECGKSQESHDSVAPKFTISIQILGYLYGMHSSFATSYWFIPDDPFSINANLRINYTCSWKPVALHLLSSKQNFFINTHNRYKQNRNTVF
jgi:hypothetical protein